MSEGTVAVRCIGSTNSSSPELLPREAPLDMPAQDFEHCVARPARRVSASYWMPRAGLFAGSFLLTAAFAYELHGVLAFQQITPFQFLFLVLSTIAFGWIALGTLSATLGFLPLFAGEKSDTIDLPAPGGELRGRTALLFPVYYENPARIAGAVDAISTELHSMGRAQAFDVFILSDTREERASAEEERAYTALKRRLQPVVSVYYRRRRENPGRKSGNIKDWVQRFGGAYANFVILDGDSVMSGTTLVRLALAMQRDGKAGLIQTVPRLAGATTLLQHLHLFASNVYGAASAAGLAFWYRDEGNYWGHNAIIRTEAFAAAAGLPALPGPPPFGGDIQSHDFVEAALLQRAGWGVHMVPTVVGSYEGLPPTLLEVIARDRRWAQGNLQHLSIVGASGLTPMGRVHLLMGAASYLVSPIWAASLVVGVVLALQGEQVIPTYFTDIKTLFPIWPVINPGAALRLFLATMAVVLMPKALGLVLEIKRARYAREPLGALRAVLGVALETVFSILLSPILMVTQTVAVFQVLFGVDAGWRAQRRDTCGLSLSAALKLHYHQMLLGAALAVLCWKATPVLVVWMAPVILGLMFAPLLSWLVARPAGPVLTALLSTRDERNPPAILERARRSSGEWATLIASPPEPDAIGELPRAA